MADSRERIRGPSRDGREFLTSPRQVLRRLMLLSEGRQYREAAGVVGRLGPSVLRSVIAELPLDLLLEHLPHSAYLLESFFTRLTTLNTTPKPDVPSETVAWQLLRERRRSFDNAVQGLGVHGLTTDASGQLISLHVALKTELQRHVETYKMAIHKLEELSMVTINQDPAHSSHQRLLAINYGDIQQRLIDNKTLLTMLDKPTLKQLQTLVENLSTRVENDKEVLSCVGQVKRLDAHANVEKRPAAGLLMNFSRGCEVVLHMMGPESVPPNPLAIEEVPVTAGGSSCSDGYHSDDSASDDGSEMVSLYRNQYIENRADALEALDSLPQLKHAHSLKGKILFSMIVLSFRLCHAMRERKVMEVRRVLNCALDSSSESTLALDRAVRHHLHETTDSFPLGEIERSVFNQVLSTLHEYPCLESCPPLTHYVSACVRLAWRMINQKAPYYLDMDFSLGFLRPEKHERHPKSDRRSDLIKAFLWPALMQNNQCAFKAVVAT
ncbi:GL14067 [Drosophila persimilis]|uniref:Mitochondria-eating protein n=1 Tax=Drosophila persimilis TaxID=7234 RepID=B4GNQ4_DROPE|nr:GL14067 [Drosophila persimilis]